MHFNFVKVRGLRDFLTPKFSWSMGYVASNFCVIVFIICPYFMIPSYFMIFRVISTATRKVLWQSFMVFVKNLTTEIWSYLYIHTCIVYQHLHYTWYTYYLISTCYTFSSTWRAATNITGYLNSFLMNDSPSCLLISFVFHSSIYSCITTC